MRCTLQRDAYLKPCTVMASLRSRERKNCGSLITNRRTLYAAIAVETPAAPSSAMPHNSRQLMREADCAFLLSRAIVRPSPQFLQNPVARLSHVSRAQGQNEIAIGRGAGHGVHPTTQRAHILHTAMAELANPIDEGFRGHPFDRLLRRRIDIHHEETVCLVKGARELIHQVKRPRVAMWLKQHVDAAEPAQAGSIERSPDLSRMMAVIVHHGDAAFLAAQLKAPVDPAEDGEAFADRVRIHLELHRNRDGRRRVEYVVPAGDREMEASEIRSAIAETEVAGERSAGNLRRLDVRLSARSVGDGAAANLG